MDKFKIKDSENPEIFRVNSKYFYLTDKKKLEVLLLMDEWVKTELGKLQNTPSNSDYAKCDRCNYWSILEYRQCQDCGKHLA